MFLRIFEDNGNNFTKAISIYRFLGYVDLLGTTYHSSVIATGYGAHIAIPLLRKAVEGREDTLTEQDAQKILDDAMRVLYYRDARSLNKVKFLFIVMCAHARIRIRILKLTL